MRALPALLAAGLLCASGTVGLGVNPAAAAPGGGSTRAGDAAEAWYDTSESTLCSSPVGCPPVTLPLTSYPANTLHVGVSEGTQTSTTYLLPDLSAYLGSALPTAGSMTLPLATVSGNGNDNPSAAAIEACLSSAAFPDGTQASTGPPPPTNCSVHAQLAYTGSGFTLDLTPFLHAWSTGTPDYGVALLAEPTGIGATTSWQVAFNGRNLAGAAHIYSTFSPAAPTPTAVGASSASAAAVGVSGPTNPPSTSSGVAVTPSPAATPTPAAVSPSAVAAGAVPGVSPADASPGPGGPMASAPERTASPVTATNRPLASSAGGFQYPEILLLPLVLAAAALSVLRLLTGDATPRRLRAR